MIIETISQKYRTVRELGGGRIEAYVCVREGCPPDRKYLLLGLTGEDLPKGLNAYFLKLAEKKNGNGAPDCFTRNGSLWLTFPYRDDPSLAERTDLTQEERLETFRSLMEQIVIKRLPLYLAYEALRPDNVAVSHVPEVSFNFFLTEPDEYACCSLLMVQRRLADCLRILFASELDAGLVPELDGFIRDLEEEDAGDYFEIYRRFRPLYGRLKEKREAGELREKPLALRIWESLRRALKPLKRVLAAALLLALAAALVWLILNPRRADEGRIPFTGIGTLRIRQEEESASYAGIEISAVGTAEETRSE